jgi:hypothetical protein
MMHLQLYFLVLRIMIRYHIMIPLSPLASLIVVPYQIFSNMTCMILAMILMRSIHQRKKQQQRIVWISQLNVHAKMYK